jgi:predicted nuclease of predicted toxin-antitoxin system
MRFLTDESCDFAVVRVLREAGHDVSAVSEFQQRSVDRELMDMPYLEDRILITEDKDFGWLAFVARVTNPGVILIRFQAVARPLLALSAAKLIAEFGEKLIGAFVVLSPGSVRISQRPDNPG